MAIRKIDVIHELWRRGDLSWKLDSLQKKIRNQSADLQESLTLASRQIGKSYEAIIEALETCIRNPYKIVRVLAPNLKQVSDIVDDNITPICLDAPPGFIRRIKSSYRWQVGLSSLRLGALERQYVDANRGGNAILIICEEGGFVPSDDYKYAYESVIGPQLLRSKGRIKHITSPSEDELHYIHTEILPKCELLNAVARYTVYDSPSITPEQINQAIKLCGGTHTVAWLREYMAQIIRNVEKVIIPSFDESRHVASRHHPDYAFWVMSFDCGGSRDQHAITLKYFDFVRGKTVVKENHYWEPGTNTDVIVEYMKGLEQKYRIGDEFITRVADAPAQLLIDIAKKHQYHMILPPKDNRDAALNNIDIAFADNLMEIDPSCKHLIATLKGGRWNDQRTDFVRTKALGHLDSLMALCYGYRVVKKSSPFPAVSFNSAFQLQVKPPAARDGETQLANALGQTRPKIRMMR